MPKKFLFENITILSINDRSFMTHRLPMALAAQQLSRVVWVICEDTGMCEEIKKLGFRVVKLQMADSPLNVLAGFKTLRELWVVYRRIRPDLVYHSSVQMSFIGSFARSLSDIKVAINSITGVGFLFSSNQAKAVVCRALLLWPLRILWRKRSTVMLFQNLDDKSLFLEKGLAEEDAPIIAGSGVDDKKFRPAKKRNFSKSKDNPIVIGCATRLIRDKGIGELVEAVKIVAQKYHVSLKIAGDTYSKNPSNCSEHDIQLWSKYDSITFLGNVSDMVGFWQSCDIAILPSHREGLPRALLEAAACGLPLLGANVPGTREVVRDGVNGLLFSAANHWDIATKIEKLICNEPFRKSAGDASRVLIERGGFSNSAVQSQFIKLFRSIRNLDAAANNK